MSAKRPKLYLVFFILAVLGTVVPAAFLLGSAYYSEHRQAAQDARNVSGVLEAQATQVIEAYAPYLPLAVGAVHEGWCRLEGRRP